eukprot:792624_1
MMLLFTISILVFPPASTASSVFNTTAFVATGMTEHPVNSSSAYYTTEDPSAEPTLEPTWMPTMDGEFPYIHHTQSYIACGKNIELHDSMYTNVYAGFATNQTISISLQFIVCKASSTFHYWDELHLWHGDANNYTEWNVTTFAPTLSSISTQEVDDESAKISQKMADDFVTWIPNNIKTSIITVPPQGTEMIGTFL